MIDTPVDVEEDLFIGVVDVSRPESLGGRVTSAGALDERCLYASRGAVQCAMTALDERCLDLVEEYSSVMRVVVAQWIWWGRSSLRRGQA